ncbi:MAG: cyclic-phosphate processing receiver domain-containing protein [Ferruginibacter sp.]
MWKLWLDDDWSNIHTPGRHPLPGYIGAGSTVKAIDLIEKNGLPVAMDLDHDLNGYDNAMIFLHWLYDKYPGCISGIEVTVHSMNPVGKANIISFVDSWKRFLEQETS